MSPLFARRVFAYLGAKSAGRSSHTPSTFFGRTKSARRCRRSMIHSGSTGPSLARKDKVTAQRPLLDGLERERDRCLGVNGHPLRDLRTACAGPGSTLLASGTELGSAGGLALGFDGALLKGRQPGRTPGVEERRVRMPELGTGHVPLKRRDAGRTRRKVQALGLPYGSVEERPVEQLPARADH